MPEQLIGVIICFAAVNKQLLLESAPTLCFLRCSISTPVYLSLRTHNTWTVGATLLL